jgi:endogenous inhibitor of DNA gyrase (YacG/DUF329 family)
LITVTSQVTVSFAIIPTRPFCSRRCPNATLQKQCHEQAERGQQD